MQVTHVCHLHCSRCSVSTQARFRPMDVLKYTPIKTPYNIDTQCIYNTYYHSSIHYQIALVFGYLRSINFTTLFPCSKSRHVLSVFAFPVSGIALQLLSAATRAMFCLAGRLTDPLRLAKYWPVISSSLSLENIQSAVTEDALSCVSLDAPQSEEFLTSGRPKSGRVPYGERIADDRATRTRIADDRASAVESF